MFFRALRGGGAARHAAASQRGYSLSEENTPFRSPRERRGASPSTPALAVGGLKSCTRCAIGCLPSDVSKRFGLLLLPAAALPACRQPSAISVYFGFHLTCRCLPRRGIAALAALFAPSVEGGEIALAALISTLVRRKLACTSARWAERQRVVGVGQIVSHPQWRRAKQCRHAGHFRSPGAALLRAASRQCNFLWVGLREGYLFFKKRYPSLVSPLLWHIFPPSCPYYGRKSKREGGYGALIGKLRGKCTRAG